MTIDIVSIMLLIALIITPILVLITAISYRWYLALIPLIIFTIFWIIWFILDTTVPFDMMEKGWFLALALIILGVSVAVGWLVRWENKTKKCDPKIETCQF